METDVTKEAVSSALEFLSKDSKKAGSLNRWCFVTPKGKKSPEDYVCFATLRSDPDNRKMAPPSGCLAVTYTGGPGKEPRVYNYDEDSRDFVSFLVGPESPWRHCLVPFLVQKDPNEIFESRGFVFGNLEEINYLSLLNFLIATRMCLEFPSKFQTMKTLIADSVSPFDAYITAQTFVTYDSGKFAGDLQRGHEPFSSHQMSDLIVRLRSGEVNGINRSFYGGYAKDYPPGVQFSYFSSPFWSKRDPKFTPLGGFVNKIGGIDLLHEYIKALHGDTNLPEKKSRVVKPRFNVDIKQDTVEVIEELNF